VQSIAMQHNRATIKVSVMISPHLSLLPIRTQELGHKKAGPTAARAVTGQVHLPFTQQQGMPKGRKAGSSRSKIRISRSRPS